MDFRSHMFGGVALGVGAIYLARKVNIPHESIAILGGSIIGSLIPDIDHPKSFLGNKVPVISEILYSTLGHRSLTHSLLFAFILGLIGSLFNGWLGLGISIGILSHILLDLLTPQGVAFLYPFIKKRIKIKGLS